MYTKLDRPGGKGELAYDNKGSCDRLVNYLFDQDKIEGKFFNANSDNISKKDAADLINNNVKGLKATDIKFYSLTLNPSKEELDFLKSDSDKLRSYTKSAMVDFANNIKDSQFRSEDLVWTAIIHDKRHFTNLDKHKYEKKGGQPFPHKTIEDIVSWKKNNPGGKCPFEKEAIKPGNNAHIHILISRRNFEMDKTLTIHGRNSISKFNLMAWQEANQKRFQTMFKYKVGENLYSPNHLKFIDKKLNSITSTGYFIDRDKVVKEFIKCREPEKQVFLKNLSSLDYQIKKGNVIEDPHFFMKNGKDRPKEQLNTQMGEVAYNIDNFLFKAEESASNYSYDSIVSYGKKRKKKKNKNLNI